MGRGNDKTCENCPLGQRPFVQGCGNADCKLLVVGTAPGKTEEITGFAFTGKTGTLVRELLSDLGIDKDAYYTNLLKKRPTEGTQQRKPSKQECWKCGSHLIAELATMRPQVILTLGATPLSYILGARLRVGVVHGLPIPMSKFNHTMTIVPTFDASYVLRSGGVNSTTGDEWISDLEELQTQVNMI